MKILGIVGSMRKNKNSYLLIHTALESVEKMDSSIKTKIIQLADLNIESCRACYELCSKRPYECVIKDDLSMVFEEMKTADGILIASPLYFPMPSRLVALMERLACLSYSLGCEDPSFIHPLEDKPCGLIAVAGGDNVRPVLYHLQNFAHCLHMDVITLKSFPYIGVGGKGDVRKDKDLEPIKNAEVLGALLVKAARSKKSKDEKET
jgi:multimeric flavodoxin WrbA